MRTSRWRAGVAALALLLEVAGCGGGSGKSSPVEPTEDVARIQPGDRPVRFRLDTAVPEDLQRFVVETLGWVHADLGDSGPLTIHVYSDEPHFVTAYTRDFGITPAEARVQLVAGQFAFATPGGHIWIYLTNFEMKNVASRRVTLFHEYTHTLQQWLADIRFQSSVPDERSFVPRWIVEGCAEYLAVNATGRRHLVDEGRARAGIVASARTSTEPLEALETAGEASFRGGTGEAYTVGWLGCERLSMVKGEDGIAQAFWQSFAKLREWRAAFADAFGVTPAAFYKDFEAYRATL